MLNKIDRGDLVLEDKIKGALFGLAIGDALGITVEFMEPNEIKEKYGIHTEIMGGGKFSFDKGEVSDDTEMTLCVVNGIFKNRIFPIDYIAEEFLTWFDSKPKDIGMTVMYSLDYFHVKGTWEGAAEWTHNLLGGKSAGNGSLMRTLPIGLIYEGLERIERVSKEQSELTHYDTEATEACILYNRIVHHLLKGKSLKEAIQKEVKNTIYANVLEIKPSFPPDGYVVHTLYWALYQLLHTSSYEECLINCVNMGYDADTVAAIAGGLAGLHYGYKTIPKRWIDELKIKEKLHEVTEKIIEIKEINE